MKLTAAREDFLAPLQSVIGVVERRQTMPVLANVLLSARDNRLSITGTDLEEWLRSLGVTPRSFFGDETDEPSVIGWMPAAAIYFQDPDGHLLEYISMLDGAPKPELGIVPWSQAPTSWLAVDRSPHL